jgi:hypothetical protein
MKYRIKHVAMIGYFAQVKRNWFIGWETIGEHANDQVVEYSEDHLGRPLADQQDAVLLAHRHADYNNAKKGFTTYRDIAL